jgi:hypothetical protein
VCNNSFLCSHTKTLPLLIVRGQGKDITFLVLNYKVLWIVKRINDGSIKLCWMERDRRTLLGSSIIAYAMYLIQSMSVMSSLCFLISIDTSVILAKRHYAKRKNPNHNTCRTMY